MPSPRSALLTLCLLPLGMACGSSTPADAGGSTWWIEAQRAAASSGGRYDLFTAPAAAIAVLPSDQPLSCPAGLPAPDAGDTWSIRIALAVPHSGTTVTVGGTVEDATSSSNASVYVYHQEPNQTVGWTAYAVSGQLTLTSFPADTASVGTAFAGHLTALFPDDPISTIDCQGGGESLPDGGFAPAPGACAGQLADGGTFTCDVPASDTTPQSCCEGDGGTTNQNYQLSFDFSATGCPQP